MSGRPGINPHKLAPWRDALAAFAAGAAMPLAYSPYDHKWIAILALAVWLAIFMRGRALVIGFAFGFGWFGTGAWWLVETFHTFGPLAYPLALLAVALIGAALALLPMVWAWLCKRLVDSGMPLAAAFPVLAVGEEWLRGWLFTGLPWTPLGNLLLDTPAIGWAAYVGVYGAALIPALLAVGLYLLAQRSQRPAGLAALLAGILVIAFAPAPLSADGRAYRAALVQGNIPQDVKWDAAFLGETMRRYAQASAEAAARSDVIVWPEAAVPMFLSRAPAWDAWLVDRVNEWGRPLLFGGIRWLDQEQQGENGVFLALPGKNGRAFAGKRHLVPFGEYVPTWLPFIRALAPGIAAWRPAKDAGILSAKGIRYGCLVCYEGIFPEEARRRVEGGAEVLVNVTNDAWYGRSPAPWQHLQSARMRAVETGRYLLRAANTGITAIIAPNGAVTVTAPWFTQAVVYGEFRTSRRRSFYQRWGNTVLLVLPLIAAGMWWWQRR